MEGHNLWHHTNQGLYWALSPHLHRTYGRLLSLSKAQGLHLRIWRMVEPTRKGYEDSLGNIQRALHVLGAE